MYTVPSTYLCVSIISPVLQSGQKGIMQLHSTVDVTTVSSRYTVLGVEGDVLKGCGLVYRCQGMLMNIVINYACVQ